MKSISTHDPLDDLIAAALHGELTPEERTQFESRLDNDPAAQAAYQEAQLMHDLLEKTHASAQPDAAFEQRMVSGVRRKIQDGERPRETAWESVLVIWIGLKRFFAKRQAWEYITVSVILMVLAGVTLGPITSHLKKAQQSAEMQQARVLAMAPRDVQNQNDAAKKGQTPIAQVADADEKMKDEFSSRLPDASAYNRDGADSGNAVAQADADKIGAIPSASSTQSPPVAFNAPMPEMAPTTKADSRLASIQGSESDGDAPKVPAEDVLKDLRDLAQAKKEAPASAANIMDVEQKMTDKMASAATDGTPTTVEAAIPSIPTSPSAPSTTTAVVAAAAIDARKLIRNAQLDLEVKSFQTAMDQITALTKGAGGYVDTSNSQRGGNGKLQGTVVVKVLPQHLDDFLLKLRDLGEVQNQSVSTEDVTKDYFDTQARLDNSRRMETQLQDLLNHENSKVSDLLQVERELGRVRGDIEQMQGQLKLYDFEVQYATVTIQVSEKDMNQTAAYLLREQDDFSLFATDVEGTFQKARQAADEFKAQVLVANLVHNSGSDVAAELTVMVAPDQIEPFLGQVRSLGRVANFTRQTQRVAKDGGDSEQPADQTLTEKDKVQVHLAIRSDDETRKQVALTVVTQAVDDALDQAKTAALAQAGVEILSSSLNKTAQGPSTAQLTVRVPGNDYSAVIGAFKALGRTASLSIQRNDNSGPGANGDDAPVIVSLGLTDDDTPRQETEMSVLAPDVDSEAQQIKKDAGATGVEIKASNFQQQPDGTEMAHLMFRLPMSKYPAFMESLKSLGKVESLTVRRDDRPDQTRADDDVPVEIGLQLHNQRNIVADNNGIWATLRQTLGDGAEVFFGSVRAIGVVIAFLAPWVFTLGLFAWFGRRIYVWWRK